MKAPLRASGSTANAPKRRSLERRARTPRAAVRLEPLIGQVYEASVHPDGWRPALSALANTVGADAITLLAGSLHGPLRETTFGPGTSPAAEASYREHFAAVDAWAAACAAEGPLADGDMRCACRPGSDATRCERSDGYYQPPGWQHGFAARLVHDEGSLVAAIAGHRLGPRGGFDAAQLALVRQLVPHLRRALRVGHQLALAALERDAGAQLLGRSGIGVIVADEHGRVLRTNAAASSLLAARDGLSLAEAGLEAASCARTRALRSAIANALHAPTRAGGDRGEGGGDRLALARPSGARPYLVEIAPLERTAGSPGTGRALAMILVSGGESAPVLHPEPLRILYGLTRTEAELAVGIAEGRSLEEIRADRGVTSNTVRGQLKNVFRKTGTHRQADLVRVVLEGTPFRR